MSINKEEVAFDRNTYGSQTMGDEPVSGAADTDSDHRSTGCPRCTLIQ
jgi:hypothetical protein